MAGRSAASAAVLALRRALVSTLAESRAVQTPRVHLLAWSVPPREWITRDFGGLRTNRGHSTWHWSSAPRRVPSRGLHASTSSRSHDAEALNRGDASWAITTPIISDQVSIPDGVVGDVVEIPVSVGDVVDEGTHAVIIETHKACLNVKATGHRRMRVVEVLTRIGQEVKEGDRLLMVEKAFGVEG